jgi:N-acyl-D-aspartate/D-glutamate deacylase
MSAHQYDVVIKDGFIFDGTGAPRVRGDVAVANGRVVATGRIAASAGRDVVDARGMHVAPGFVDLHTHYDAQVFWDPYCTLSGWHGVTSVAIGNCGFGFAPVEPGLRDYAMRSMTRVEAIPYESMRLGLPWSWVTFPQYLDALDATPKAVNVLPYVPVGPMLVHLLGLEGAKAGRLPDRRRARAPRAMLHESMDAGRLRMVRAAAPADGPAAVQRDWDGTAMPTDVMHDETCRVLASVLAERNQGVQQLTLTTADIRHDLAHLEEIACCRAGPCCTTWCRRSRTGHTCTAGRSSGSNGAASVASPVYGQG